MTDNLKDLWGDDAVGGTGYEFPMLQWGYGDKKSSMKNDDFDSQGGWFISEDSIESLNDTDLGESLPDALLAAGWSKDQFTTSKGDIVPGFWAKVIEVSPIHERMKWTSEDAAFGGRGAYDKALAHGGDFKSRLHVMVLVRGLVDYGPFILSMGPASGMAWAGASAILSKGLLGIKTEHITKIQPAIKAAYGIKSAKMCVVWTPIGVSEKFVEMGSDKSSSWLRLPQPLHGDIDISTMALNREEVAIHKMNIAEQKEWAAAWNDLGSDQKAAADKAPTVTKEEAEVMDLI